MSNISYNPAKVTVASNTFYSSSEGGVQGFYNDDPAIRNALRSALVAAAQTTALWGGMAVTAAVPPGISAGPPNTGSSGRLAALLTLATAEANISGFTVWNGSLATVLNPSVADPIPLAAGGDGTNPGGAINWFAMGSGAEIWVQCTSAIATSLRAGGGWGAQAVYWDYTNQVLLNTAGGTALPVEVVDVQAGSNSMVVNSAGTGWTYNGNAVLIKI